MGANLVYRHITKSKLATRLDFLRLTLFECFSVDYHGTSAFNVLLVPR